MNYKVLTKLNFGSEIQDVLKYYGVSNTELFLHPKESSIESPYLFKTIPIAVNCFVNHIENEDEISIVVDCDADGYTSSSVMYQYIKRLKPNININTYIHNGKEHGIKDVVNEICNDNSKLVIIPDAGTSDSEECKMLKQHNKSIIILDHHNVLPKDNPSIIVNNQLEEQITDKAMTGVGIVYKFCKCLDDFFKVNYADDYLDLLALGMISDRCDMFNPQTRYLVFKGMDIIRKKENHNKFITTLVEAQSFTMKNRVTVETIGFYIAPLINALIRLGEYENKKIMFRAICNSNETLIRKIRGKGECEISIQEYSLKDCQSAHRKQKSETEKQTNALDEDITKFGLNQYPILVCNAKDNVDSTFTGLIANQLASKYCKPVLLLRRYDDYCSGSGRGYNKSYITNLNEWCKETKLFSKVEGHDNAMGIGISFDNICKLYEKLSTMKVEPFLYHVFGEYDATKLPPSVITSFGKYDYIWGNGVDEPLFVIKNINVNKFNITLNGTKKNKIEFMYKNITFRKATRATSLEDEYNKIIELGDNINFTVVGKFKLDYSNGKAPLIMIEDMEYEKGKKINFFS